MNANSTPPAPALVAETAQQKITELQTALKAADDVAQLLLVDPHFRNCPFVAAIRGPITAGIDRIDHLVNWFGQTPIPLPPPAPAPAAAAPALAPAPAPPLSAPISAPAAIAEQAEEQAGAEMQKEIGVNPDNLN